MDDTQVGLARWGWLGQRDGAVIKSDGYSSQGPGFDFQHLYNGSQLPATPIPEDRMPSSGLCIQVLPTYKQKQNTPIHRTKISASLF